MIELVLPLLYIGSRIFCGAVRRTLCGWYFVGAAGADFNLRKFTRRVLDRSVSPHIRKRNWNLDHKHFLLVSHTHCLTRSEESIDFREFFLLSRAQHK